MPGRRVDAGDGGAPPCPRREDATAWIQGQLPPAEEIDFRAHLAECSECMAEAGEVEEILAGIRSSGATPRKVDLLPRVLARLDEERARASVGRWHRRARSRRFAAAAAILVAGASLAVLGRTWLERGPVAREDGDLAAERAIDWLEQAQEASGGFHAARWGGLSDYDVGLTGLAALAFLSRPEPARPRASMALDFIVASQSTDGRFGPEFAGAVYNHGIATTALLEAFGATRDEKLRTPIDRALFYIDRTQRRGGGWSYVSAAEVEANTSATCWPLQALLVARSLGWKGLDAAIEGGFRHLARVTDERGRVGYRRAGEFEAGPEALSSMGAVCLLLGKDLAAVPQALRGRILDGVARAAARPPAGHDLYRDFFLHSALEAFPAPRRGSWTGTARRALLARQVREGPYLGSWEPNDTWGPAGGRVYSTAMGALILDARERGERLEEWMGARG